jgi:hypothetical protein
MKSEEEVAAECIMTLRLLLHQLRMLGLLGSLGSKTKIVLPAVASPCESPNTSKSAVDTALGIQKRVMEARGDSRQGVERSLKSTVSEFQSVILLHENRFKGSELC